MRFFIVSLVLVPLMAISAFAKSSSCGTKADIDAAYNAWSAALSSGKPQEITALYDASATMQPTLLEDANTPAIRAEYFSGLMKNPNLKATLQKNDIKIVCPAAVNTGTYTFSFTNDKGEETRIPARFTFVYEKTPKGWLIINHHSSKLPN